MCRVSSAPAWDCPERICGTDIAELPFSELAGWKIVILTEFSTADKLSCLELILGVQHGEGFCPFCEGVSVCLCNCGSASPGHPSKGGCIRALLKYLVALLCPKMARMRSSAAADLLHDLGRHK